MATARLLCSRSKTAFPSHRRPPADREPDECGCESGWRSDSSPRCDCESRRIPAMQQNVRRELGKFVRAADGTQWQFQRGQPGVALQTVPRCGKRLADLAGAGVLCQHIRPDASDQRLLNPMANRVCDAISERLEAFAVDHLGQFVGNDAPPPVERDRGDLGLALCPPGVLGSMAGRGRRCRQSS